MCDAPPPIDPRLSRRRFLVTVPVGAAAHARVRPSPAVAAAPGLDITPRTSWGADLAPKGPIPDEPDVRVLLVHHSVSANSYAQTSVPGMLRGIYSFHTGDKGWPDVAYNFFVDRFGGVWEGRTGSLAGPKAGDATGGNQGFSQLCCFLGDHSSAAPSPAAQASMGALLGWLAQRHGIDLGDGARARFTSRGSNLYAAGAPVDVATVSGHRDVTKTACPGDAAYALVADGTFRRLAGGAPAAPAPTTTSTTKPRPAPTTTSSTTSTTAAPTTTAPVATSTTRSELAAPVTAANRPDDGANGGEKLLAVGAAAATVAGGVIVWRSRTNPQP
jgi:hypothetical protein